MVTEATKPVSEENANETVKTVARECRIVPVNLW
jgi:hypothetical protein